MDARDMGQDLEKVLFTEEQIMTNSLSSPLRLTNTTLVAHPVVGVLRGAVMVSLISCARSIRLAMDWMAVVLWQWNEVVWCCANPRTLTPISQT